MCNIRPALPTSQTKEKSTSRIWYSACHNIGLDKLQFPVSNYTVPNLSISSGHSKVVLVDLIEMNLYLAQYVIYVNAVVSLGRKKKITKHWCSGLAEIIFNGVSNLLP